MQVSDNFLSYFAYAWFSLDLFCVDYSRFGYENNLFVQAPNERNINVVHLEALSYKGTT